MTVLRSALATDVGKVRANNQDRGLAGDTLSAVADGMGGHQGGEVAATVAIEALRDAFPARGSVKDLLEAVHRANSAVWQKASEDEDLRGMGTTLTAVAAVVHEKSERLALVNVGDSRTYLLRDGNFSQVTADHSLVEEMVRAGHLSHEQAAVHPKRHILTRALGIESEVEVDTWLLPPATGDRLLLCSDGLINEVQDSDMAEVLRTHHQPEDAATVLVDMAKAHGGNDNITVVVVDVLEGHGGGDLQAANNVALRTSLAKTTVPADSTASESGGQTPIQRDAFPQTVPVQSSRDLPNERRVTLRVILFIVLLAAVLGGSAAAIWFYNQNSYFVTLQKRQVVIERGRPGGLLWLEPTLISHTGLFSSHVVHYRLAQLKSGAEEPSLAAARQFVANLKSEYISLSLPSTPPATAVGPSNSPATSNSPAN